MSTTTIGRSEVLLPASRLQEPRVALALVASAAFGLVAVLVAGGPWAVAFLCAVATAVTIGLFLSARPHVLAAIAIVVAISPVFGLVLELQWVQGWTEGWFTTSKVIAYAMLALVALRTLIAPRTELPARSVRVLRWGQGILLALPLWLAVGALMRSDINPLSLYWGPAFVSVLVALPVVVRTRHGEGVAVLLTAFAVAGALAVTRIVCALVVSPGSLATRVGRETDMPDLGAPRLAAVFGNSSVLALFMMLAVLASVWLFLRTRNRTIAALWLAAAFGAFLVVNLAGSLHALLLTVAGAITVVVAGRPLPLRRVVVLAAGTVIVAPLTFVAGSAVQPLQEEGIAALWVGIAQRSEFWRMALDGLSQVNASLIGLGWPPKFPPGIAVGVRSAWMAFVLVGGYIALVGVLAALLVALIALLRNRRWDVKGRWGRGATTPVLVAVFLGATSLYSLVADWVVGAHAPAVWTTVGTLVTAAVAAAVAADRPAHVTVPSPTPDLPHVPPAPRSSPRHRERLAARFAAFTAWLTASRHRERFRAGIDSSLTRVSTSIRRGSATSLLVADLGWPRAIGLFALFAIALPPVSRLPSNAGLTLAAVIGVVLTVPVLLATRTSWLVRVITLVCGVWFVVTIASGLVHDSVLKWVGFHAAAPVLVVGNLCLLAWVLREPRRWPAVVGAALLGSATAAAILGISVGQSELWRYSLGGPITAVVVIAAAAVVYRGHLQVGLAMLAVILGLNLVVGLRSVLLQSAVAVLVAAAYAVLRRTRVPMPLVVSAVASLLVLALITPVYGAVASSGLLGREQQGKWNSQSDAVGGIILGGRPEFSLALRIIPEVPVLGIGVDPTVPPNIASIRDAYALTLATAEADASRYVSTHPEIRDVVIEQRVAGILEYWGQPNQGVYLHSALFQYWLWLGPIIVIVFGSILTAGLMLVRRAARRFGAPGVLGSMMLLAMWVWDAVFSPPSSSLFVLSALIVALAAAFELRASQESGEKAVSDGEALTGP